MNKEKVEKVGELQRDYDINGKKVTFRKSLRVKDARNWSTLVGNLDNLDASKVIPIAAVLIENWEFDGDPAYAKNYDNLDLWDELIPLGEAILKYLVAQNNAKMEERAKNQEKRSSKPSQPEDR